MPRCLKLYLRFTRRTSKSFWLPEWQQEAGTASYIIFTEDRSWQSVLTGRHIYHTMSRFLTLATTVQTNRLITHHDSQREECPGHYLSLVIRGGKAAVLSTISSRILHILHYTNKDRASRVICQLRSNSQCVRDICLCESARAR